MRLVGLALVLTLALTSSAGAAQRTRDALGVLLASTAIDQPTYDRAAAAYDAAIVSLRTLRGTRHAELKAVVTAVDGIAARGQLTAGRLPAIVLTLERNRSWWTSGPLLAGGARLQFPGSELVWQHYYRQGIQIQWLATFGRANALWQYGSKDAELRVLLTEAIALAAPRAGGLAWEYLVPFNGGRPPWVSGLAQGTALTALSRAAAKLGDRSYLDVAHAALGIFSTPPPEGVLVPTAVGSHYLQYSFAPGLRILNGFVQALNGLHDYAAASADPTAQALFAAGDLEAQAELPSYDTGGWSRYSQLRDSDLAYHKLLRDFLRGLCQRTGTAAYCETAERFTADLVAPPTLTLVTPTKPPRQARSARLRITIDKPATVALSVRRAGFSHTARARFSAGARYFRWRPPRAGPYRVSLTATDLAGNVATVTGIAHVRR